MPLVVQIHYEKYRNFNLISWCGNFTERHSFCIVSGDSPETLRKLYLSAKFPHRKSVQITVIFAVIVTIAIISVIAIINIAIIGFITLILILITIIEIRI